MKDATFPEWETVKIGEVCDLMTGGTPSRSKAEYFEGDIKWLVSGDIHRGEITDCDGRLSEEGLANSNARLLPVNSVMIALNGQGKTRGTVAMLRTEATCNQSLVSIMPKDKDRLLPEFVFMNLRGRYDEIRKMTGDAGNERRGLNMRLIRGIEIPLPPLKEQRRIIAVLDEAFEVLARARAHAEVNRKDAGLILSAFLDEQVSEMHRRFGSIAVGEIAAVKGGKRLPKGEKTRSVKTLYPYITVRDFTEDGTVSTDTLRYISKEIQEGISRYTISCDDVYVSIAGTIGKTGIVPDELDGANLTENAAKLVLKEGWDKRFVYWWTRSTNFAEQALEQTRVAAQPKLALQRLASISLPKADGAAQASFIEEVAALKEKTAKLSHFYTQEIQDLDDLRQSLLQKAFAGKLT